jgi:asparagine synthase (glutamine-hydrolysing)
MEIEVDLHKEKEAIAYLKQNHWLNSLMSFDQQSYLPNDLLVKEDRATMAHSLEGRVPFLDHELVEFANSISPLYKLNGNEGKYLLKKAMSSQLPQELLYRKKQGFGVPLDHYFRTELQSFAEEILFDFSGHDYYQKPELRQLWEAHQSGQSNYASLFWMLISFNLWHDRWIRK